MSEPIVKIKCGLVEGYIDNDLYGDVFYAFEGIPYGEPPVGKLRFKPPVPLKPWTGILKAKSRLNKGNYTKDALMEGKSVKLIMTGSEDCLNLNVYTKQIQKDGEKLRPVMVYVHGGGFISGNTYNYGPHYLITENVVLVTLHYRLGALGFLSLDEPRLNVSGNAGLKDIVLALKWIQDNIQAFNGDKNNVTLFGHSAGAAAVNYILISPTTKGLFHKAIIQSGSSLNHWARGQQNNGLALAKILGCTSTDNEVILQFLQNVPMENLYQAQVDLKDDVKASEWRRFSPVVEDSLSLEPFLTEEPVKLMREGKFHKVPIITGYTNLEGAYFSLIPIEGDFTWTSLGKNMVCPVQLGLTDQEDRQKIEEKIMKFYFQDGVSKKQSFGDWLLITDISFLRGILKHKDYFVNHNSQPVFLYCLSAITKLGFLGLEALEKIPGVVHAAELPLLFSGDKPVQVEKNSIDEKTRRILLKLWSNFAKYGNPTPQDDDLIGTKWLPTTKNNTQLLDIGEKITMRGFVDEVSRINLWDEIFQSQECSKDY